jgi:hypothetical protein
MLLSHLYHRNDFINDDFVLFFLTNHKRFVIILFCVIIVTEKKMNMSKIRMCKNYEYCAWNFRRLNSFLFIIVLSI